MKKILVVSCIVFGLFALDSAAASSITIGSQNAGGAFPKGATRVPVLQMYVAVPCMESAFPQSMTFQHRGLGDTSDITGAYILWNGVRISTVAQVHRDEPFTVRIPTVRVDWCKKELLVLAVDIADDASAGGEHQFTFVQSDPMASVTFLKTGAKGTTIAPGFVGDITFTTLPLLTRPLYGSSRGIARFTLTASQRDQEIVNLTLTNHGSARDGDLQRIQLVNARGVILSDTLPNLTGDKLTLTFSRPFVIKKSQTLLLQVKADVRASRRRTIDFTLDEPSDLQAQSIRAS